MNRATPEFNTDGRIVLLIEIMVGKLQKEARLADRAVTNDDVLEEVRVAGYILLHHLTQRLNCFLVVAPSVCIIDYKFNS